MKKLQIILLLGLLSCQSKEQVLDIVTPDSFSIGRAEGIMSMEGFSHGHYSGAYEDGWHHGEEWGDTWSHTELEGESEATMFWLEWDLPSWEQEKEAKYEALSIIDIERAIESRIPKIIEVPVVVPSAETLSVEEVKNELKQELSPIFIAGWFGLLGLLGGVFLVSKLRR